MQINYSSSKSNQKCLIFFVEFRIYYICLFSKNFIVINFWDIMNGKVSHGSFKKNQTVIKLKIYHLSNSLLSGVRIFIESKNSDYIYTFAMNCFNKNSKLIKLIFKSDAPCCLIKC